MYLPGEDTEQSEQTETLHIYVYQERPGSRLSPGAGSWLIALIGLLIPASIVLALCLIPNTPSYRIETVSVRAHFLPLVQFETEVPIIPTGSRSYPATYAHGILTIYNGSILTQRLPAGFIVVSRSGVEIAIDTSVSIPPADPPSYGLVTVSAHALKPGRIGNVAQYSVSAVYGADVYVKNLSAFTGGAQERTVTYATHEDVGQALASAHESLTAQERQYKGLLASACQEKTGRDALVLSVWWACQFVSFSPLAGARVLAARVVGDWVVLRVRVATASRGTVPKKG